MAKSKKGIFLGAILGSMAGAVSATLIPNKEDILTKIKDQTGEWAEHAAEIGENVYEQVKSWGTSSKSKSKTKPQFTNGALLGLLVGAGAALLFAPKAGKDLRKDITKQYKNISNKKEDLIEYYNQQKPKVAKAIKRATNTALSTTKKVKAKLGLNSQPRTASKARATKTGNHTHTSRTARSGAHHAPTSHSSKSMHAHSRTEK